MFKYRRNAIILILVSFLVLYFSLKDDFNSVIDQILSINILFLFIAAVALFGSWAARSYILYLMANSFNNKYKYLKALKLIIITQFFNGITPFSTGGQPVQVYFLKKEGISTPRGITIGLQNYIVYQIALVLYGVAAIFLNYYYNIFDKVPLLKKLVIVGFLLNLVIIIITFILGFGKKANKLLTKFLVKVFTFRKTKEEKKESLKKWNEYIDRFHDSVIHLKKQKSIFIKGILISILELTFRYSIPLFLIYSVSVNIDINLMETLVATAYVMLIAAFVPIPGASGGIEYGFIAFYGAFLTGPTLIAVMLLWRFLTYYFSMLVGALTLIFYKKKGEQ